MPKKLDGVRGGYAPFYGIVTTGHTKLPSGNVVLYDGNKDDIVKTGNWNAEELQALRTHGYAILPPGWETKAQFE